MPFNVRYGSQYVEKIYIDMGGYVTLYPRVPIHKPSAANVMPGFEDFMFHQCLEFWTFMLQLVSKYKG